MMDFDREEAIISRALDALEQNVETPDLMPGIEQRLGKKPRRHRRALRAALIAAAAAVLLSATALAASLGAFDWLLETVNPAYGQLVEPVEESVTAQGIKATLIAAQQYADRAVYYVSLQDVSGQGRVTGDEWFVPGEATDVMSSIIPNRIYYDSESGTSVFEITSDSKGYTSFENEKVVLRLVDLYYNGTPIDTAMEGFDLAAAAAAGENRGERYDDPARMPDGELAVGYLADIPDAGSNFVSAVGVLNGRLTIQVGQDVGSDVECPMLWPYLLAPDGSRVDALPSASGITPTGRDGRPEGYGEGLTVKYTQYYFDVDCENLEGCTLCFEGSRCDVVRGEWDLEVDFGAVQGIFETVADIRAGDTVLEDVTVSLSPLGLSLSGSSDDQEYLDAIDVTGIDASLVTGDGETELGEGIVLVQTYPQRRDFSAGWDCFHTPVDVGAVTEIHIGDSVIETER